MCSKPVNKRYVDRDIKQIFSQSDQIWSTEDPLRHKHLSTKSTYIVFGESGGKGGQIGHISMQNIGDAPIVLIAHQRRLDNPRSAIFILRVSFKLG